MVVPHPNRQETSPAVERPDTYPQISATRLDHIFPGAMFLQMRPENGFDGEMMLEFQHPLGRRLIRPPLVVPLLYAWTGV